MIHNSQESKAQADHSFYGTNGINIAPHRYNMFITKKTTFQLPPSSSIFRRKNARIFFKLPG